MWKNGYLAEKNFSVENVFGSFQILCSSGVLRGHHDWRTIGTTSVMMVLALLLHGIVLTTSNQKLFSKIFPQQLPNYPIFQASDKKIVKRKVVCFNILQPSEREKY